MSATVAKRNYSRIKKELPVIKPLIVNIKNVSPDDYTPEFVTSTRNSLKFYKDSLDVYNERRTTLEELIDDETQLETLINSNDEDLYSELSLCIVEIEGKLTEYDVKCNKEREDREKEEERQEREKERERQEREKEKEREEREKERERQEREKEKEREEREKEREKEERDAEREMTERKEKEERDHKVKMEELAVKRLEIERACMVASASNTSSSGGVTNNNVGPYSNLPPIQLVKFDGTLEKYQEFSDNFRTLIDSKTDLADNVKLHYLKSQLVGKAAYLIEGLRITNENYKVAMDILKEEYGAPEVIQNKIYHEIQKLKLYSNKPDHIEDFYRKIEVNCMLLENQGVNINTNQLLASLLFGKLPDSIQKCLVKEKGAVISVKDIRDQMKSEMRQARMLRSLNPECDKVEEVKRHEISRPSMSVPRTGFTTVAIDKGLPPNSSDNKTQCVYCDRSHFSDECDEYRTVDVRKRKLGDRCFICLSPSHRSGFCRVEYRCWHCSKFRLHHRSLCPRKFSSDTFSDSQPYHRANVLKYDSKNSQRVSKVSKHQSHSFDEKSGYSQSCPPRIDDTDTALSAVSCAANTVVYMQTAVVKVYDQKNDDYVFVRVILDTASSHSYMSERLTKRLNLETGHSRLPMNVYTFGSLEPKRINAPEVTIKIIVEDDKSYDLNLYVVPNIVSGNTKRKYDIEFLRKVNEQYTLADSFLLENETPEFDILIGVDYYSKFMLGGKVQIDTNLFLWNTTFGFVLSGTKSTEITCVEESSTQSVLLARAELCSNHTQDIQKLDLQPLGIRERKCSIPDIDLDLQSFESTVKFENRCSVDFPWRSNSSEIIDVQSNHGLPFGRLKSQIKRHGTDGILQVYEQTLTNPLEKEILDKVSNKDLGNPCNYFYPFSHDKK